MNPRHIVVVVLTIGVLCVSGCLRQRVKCEDEQNALCFTGSGGGLNEGSDSDFGFGFDECDGECGGNTPICNDGTCEGCASSIECSALSTTTPVCDTRSGACEGCQSDGDCGEFLEAILCDESSSSCVQCVTNSDCSEGQICGEDGGCQEDLEAEMETGGTVGLCESCVTDEDCEDDDARCVSMTFGDSASVGAFCLQQSAGTCAAPYTTVLSARESISGAEAADYCGVDESLTTCAALQDFVTQTSCTSADPCGISGQEDGLCSDAGTCTIRCATAPECGLAGATCEGTPSTCAVPSPEEAPES